MGKIINLKEKALPKDCFIFKHSTACPISSRAANEVRTVDFPFDLYWINVIEQRELSNWVADCYDVQHQSPQLILIQSGKTKKIWNHGQIKKEQVL